MNGAPLNVEADYIVLKRAVLDKASSASLYAHKVLALSFVIASVETLLRDTRYFHASSYFPIFLISVRLEIPSAIAVCVRLRP